MVIFVKKFLNVFLENVEEIIKFSRQHVCRNLMKGLLSDFPRIASHFISK